ncbi:MAG: bifunctional nicotinamidase/pyrazinamidase [Planctomycetota bacterium]|nr:bifunctional nicotinamidase/pyrazinamidase [Planctomycetota bacterium]
MTALILVDLQNDFMPGGALAVREGDLVVAVANRLMPDYDHVVASQDWHPPDHLSFAVNHPGAEPGQKIELGGLPQVLWPVHCVQRSRGARLHADLDLSGLDFVVRKGMDRGIDSYSAFFDNGQRSATGLEPWLKERGIDAVDVMGLATDYCVKFTALDARRLGFAVRVITEGCRGVDLSPGDVEGALAELRDAGVEVVP